MLLYLKNACLTLVFTTGGNDQDRLFINIRSIKDEKEEVDHYFELKRSDTIHTVSKVVGSKDLLIHTVCREKNGTGSVKITKGTDTI